MTVPGPLALTCGDPAGIGPELAPKAWDALKDELAFFWIGDPAHLPAGTTWTEIAAPGEASAVMPHALPVLPHPFAGPPPVPGRPDPDHAPDIVAIIERGVRLAMAGDAAGLCTAPISKELLRRGAGFAYPGHTEFLAALGGVEHVAMMLACDELRVVPATIHIPLRQVPAALTAEGLGRTIAITHNALIRQFGIERPRIAVAGLNPHAGEGGMMGDEEARIMTPAIEAARANGIDVTGPLPADTMFHSAARSRYDAAIAAYHDQALIPVKTLAFDRAVNVTLGLPFVRTSPDHGTAFDIAGKGVASATSTIEALRMAARMAKG